MKIEDYELILNRLGIEDNSTTIEEIGANASYLRGINATSGKDYNYLIFCFDNNNKFDMKEYLSVETKMKNHAFYALIFIFDDLNQETVQYYEEYDSCSSRQKKAISELFTKKTSVFRDRRIIDIAVDDGINYLEYRKFKGLDGLIFNVSFLELKKLFVVCGSELFKQNVRLGVTTDSPERKKLVSSFEKYVKVGFYRNVIERFKIKESEIRQHIMEDLELFEQDVESTELEEFWFKHNGVTIFVEESQLVYVGPRIRLNSDKISVINGAQTMTNLYRLLYETKYCLKKIYTTKEFEFIKKEYSSIELFEKYLDEIIEEICREIYLKTVFVVGDVKYVTGISDGLNTQLPITEMDLLATNSDTDRINEMLKSKHIHIIRSGEYEDDWNISVLDFAKYYKIIQGKPGTSKNLNKKEIEQILKLIAKKKDSNTEWISKLETVINADIWWRNNRREKRLNAADEIEDKICRYGRNYLLSYSSLLQEIDDFEDVYKDFVALIRESELEKNLEAFRKDELYEDVLRIYSEKREGKISSYSSKISEIQNELENQLIGSEDKQASMRIKEVLDSLGVTLADCRIVRVDEKGNPFEHFSFSNKSFIELCDYDGENYPIYEDSLFCKEIRQERFFIVLTISNQVITKIKLLSGVSFEQFSDAAKFVYEKTINAFKSGDEMSLPRISEGLGFHVRPHALSSQDTFRFTNGKEITKRSFWANKDTVKSIIMKD